MSLKLLLEARCFSKAEFGRPNRFRCHPYSRTPWKGDQPSSQEILEKGELNDEGYLNVGGAMGLPEQRGMATLIYFFNFIPPDY